MGIEIAKKKKLYTKVTYNDPWGNIEARWVRNWGFHHQLLVKYKWPKFYHKKTFFSLILQKYMEKCKIEWKKYFWPLLSHYKQTKSQILEKWVKIVVFSNFLYDYTLEFLIFSHSQKSFIKFWKKNLFPSPLFSLGWP